MTSVPESAAARFEDTGYLFGKRKTVLVYFGAPSTTLGEGHHVPAGGREDAAIVPVRNVQKASLAGACAPTRRTAWNTW